MRSRRAAEREADQRRRRQP
uniref:Uncharacterized protein n=1 Tax=Arundo donax TaxID=35708 RepID=A0A0A8YL05_ARUDO